MAKANKKPLDKWESEEIPDEDILYFRIHKSFIKDNKPDPDPGAFRDTGHGDQKAMSTDWCKYSTPSETKNRVIQYDKDPSNYGVVEFNVKNIRDIPQKVIHTPTPNRNRAHTSVKGEKSPEIRLKIREIYKWTIRQ